MTSKYLTQSIGEEIANSISHGISALLSIAGLIVLIIYSSSHTDKLLTSIVYGISLIFLFLMSTFSHALTHKKAKKIFQILDYIAIYVLIAGTYTPVLLIGLNNTTGWVLFAFNWLLVLFGIIYKIFFIGKQELVSNILYLSMGWTGIFIVNELIENISLQFVIYCIIGGLLYSVGLFFYLKPHIKFAHFIWHLFVLAGSAVLYVGILNNLIL